MVQHKRHSIIREYREYAGVTQEQLALRLGISSMTVHRWEAQGLDTPLLRYAILGMMKRDRDSDDASATG